MSGAARQTGTAPDVIMDPAERWWVSRLNRLAAVHGGWTPPGRVEIRDVTLREGEEMAGVVLSEEQKIALAQYARSIGIQEIQVGYCGAIREHEQLARAMRRAGIDARLVSLNRSYARSGEWETEIDRAVAAGVDVVTLAALCSDDLLASAPWLPRSDVPERIEQTVGYAKAAGVNVGCGLAGATQTDPRWVEECARAAASGGADFVSLADTTGCALPEAVEFLMLLTRDAVGPSVRLSFHGHDTFGLATANALAAVRGTADIIDAVPLGLGEGSGIVPLEEIAFALEVLYGVSTGLEMDRVADFARFAAETFGVEALPTKTFIGTSIYRHAVDSHIAAILRGRWQTWECVQPSLLGQVRSLEFAPSRIRRGRSGAIWAKLEQLGHEPDSDALDRIVDRVSEFALVAGFATEDDVETIIRTELST